MRVLVDQAAQHRFSADPFAVDVDHGGAGSVAFIVWDALAYALVRPGRVVVRLVLGQDGTQMSLAEDQHAIQELSALIDALAPGRRVITFDNTGVGGSTGTTPDTVEQMARDAIAFLTAMQITQADILGFSIGSFVAQQIALVRPAIVRRLVLASSAPQGAVGMHGWAPAVIGAIGTPNTTPEAYLDVFFTQSASSRQAGQHALRRMYARTEGRDQATTWATREAQYDAVCTWGIPDHALQRLSALQMPVFVTNGDSSQA